MPDVVYIGPTPAEYRRTGDSSIRAIAVDGVVYAEGPEFEYWLDQYDGESLTDMTVVEEYEDNAYFGTNGVD